MPGCLCFDFMFPNLVLIREGREQVFYFLRKKKKGGKGREVNDMVTCIVWVAFFFWCVFFMIHRSRRVDGNNSTERG